MNRHKPYPKYKDSGVEWLGEIPGGWNNYRIDWISIIVRGNTSFKKDELLTNGEYVALQYGKTYKVDEVNEAFNFYVNGEFYKFSQVVHYGDTILISTSETIEDLGHSCFYSRNDLGLLGGEQILLKPNTKIVFERYLYYSSKVFCDTLKKYATGLKVFRFNIDDLKSIFISLPPLQEQKTIANYLDTATAKIDTLIEKQTRLIALLKEKRQAVISTAVTRGLDDTVAMKDSGVEWLGEIPEGWGVSKLKFIAYAKPSNVDKKSKDTEKNVLLCNYTDVYYNDFITNNIEFMKATATSEQIKKFALEVNDVIITKDSEDPEDIAIAACVEEVQDNLVCGYHLTHIKPIKCNGRFLFRAFNSDGIHDQFKVVANGITRYGISVYGIDNAWFPIPHISEQKDIARYIDDKTTKIDNLIKKSTKAIELLKEKRTALISAAVTGKIDVREAL